MTWSPRCNYNIGIHYLLHKGDNNNIYTKPIFSADLLIGWHIESDDHVELQKSIANAFLKFKPFWNSDLSYPLSLIMQVCYHVANT